jgi:penicillin-binding protein 1A
MNFMLNKAVEEGTGRRTLLENVKSAGKTGTTNAYRDAWFVGYTGNYVAGIWYGNDDYAPTNRMTGGSLPGMTWRQIMAYAHQGIEIKPLPGVAPGPTGAAPQVAAAPGASNAPAQPRPTMLNKRSIEVLLRVERMMENATRTYTSDAEPRRGAALAGPDAVAAAADPAPRGN